MRKIVTLRYGVLLLFFLALTSGVAFAEDRAESAEAAWDSAESSLDETIAVDNDDIEGKVDSGSVAEPVKMAQSSTGLIWGKSQKTEQAPEPEELMVTEDAAPHGPVTEPEKTTVRRPTGKPAEMSTEKFLLKSSRQRGSTDLVETVLEVSGTIKELDNEQKATSNKMEVLAGFQYEERVDRFSSATRSQTPGPLVSVRKYNLAKAKMKIGDDIKTPILDDSPLQTIVCRLEGDKVSLFSPNGSLRGEQLLLIEDLPGNTLTLDRLLPNEEVTIGDSWIVPDSVLRSFLSVDSINDSNVEAVLTAVADNMALVDVVGDISAMYLGAATEMSVRAKYQFDLETRRINWLGLLIEENRSIGHVGPGMDLVARLQVKISPIAEPQTLTDDLLNEIDFAPNASVMQLKYDGGKGPWRFSHGRDWYVYQDDPQMTVIRKLYDNALVAECNIADMGKVDVKTMPTLEKYQADLRASFGDSFGKIAAAEQRKHKNGSKIYTVLIDGNAGELALRWIYHLLTAPNGQQICVVFVVEANMLDQFADADEAILDTFSMEK